LNPQPPHLESGALPIELLACKHSVHQPRYAAWLLRFFVQCVLAAMRAEFIELNAARIIAAIFLRRVISILAIRTRECHNITYIFLSHLLTSFKILGVRHTLKMRRTSLLIQYP
jgi:hypothetical protein